MTPAEIKKRLEVSVEIFKQNNRYSPEHPNYLGPLRDNTRAVAYQLIRTTQLRGIHRWTQAEVEKGLEIVLDLLKEQKIVCLVPDQE